MNDSDAEDSRRPIVVALDTTTVSSILQPECIPGILPAGTWGEKAMFPYTAVVQDGISLFSFPILPPLHSF